MDYLVIAVGAAIGANARYLVGNAMVSWLGADFPYGTDLINITGSFLIGVILTLLTDRLLGNPYWRLLLVTGLLGGYTTFSTFSFESLTLLQAGRWSSAAIYIVTSVGLSLIGCYLGITLAHAMER